MEFDELLAQVIALLQRQGRVSYGALKRRFRLDDEYLEDIKVELIEAQGLAADEQGRILVWLGSPGAAPRLTAPSVRDTAEAPLAYTPPYLAEKIFTSRAALEGERKQVTVLFADLKGSTELIEGLDPEEARRLLDPALHVMMDAVHRYEGTVNQVLGDGIMALFGAPWPTRITPCGPVTPPWPCRRPCAAMPKRYAAPMAWRCRRGWGSILAKLSCGRLAMTCIWTTPPWARPRTWRRAWSSSPPLAVFG